MKGFTHCFTRCFSVFSPIVIVLLPDYNFTVSVYTCCYHQPLFHMQTAAIFREKVLINLTVHYLHNTKQLTEKVGD